MRYRLIQLLALLPKSLLVILLVLWPNRAFAQNQGLAITVRDVAGQGLADLAVTVYAEDGQELAQARTDDQGGVVFSGLAAGTVRIRVTGQPRNRPALYQLGNDAAGIRLALRPPEERTTLDLRVDYDGLVLPDPTTMISLDRGGPEAHGDEAHGDVVFPVAAIATPIPQPVIRPEGTTGQVGVAAPQAATPQDNWVPLVTVLIVVIAGAMMLAYQRRRDQL